jgi:hypothetical protein
MAYPRDEFERIGDEAMQEALSPMSWSAIKSRIQHLDHCAVGGVSIDATLIASLAVKVAVKHMNGARVTVQEAATLISATAEKP